jgi:hypothetical protein
MQTAKVLPVVKFASGLNSRVRKKRWGTLAEYSRVEEGPRGGRGDITKQQASVLAGGVVWSPRSNSVSSP